MSESAKWYLRTSNDTFGPEAQEKLVQWATLGRIQPGQEISQDNVSWMRVEEVPFLDMRFSIDIGDGRPRGPFNKAAADALVASGRLPPGSKVVEVRPPFSEEKTECAEANASGEKVARSASCEQTEDCEATRPTELTERIPHGDEPVEVNVEEPIEESVEKEDVGEICAGAPVEEPVEEQNMNHAEKDVYGDVHVEVTDEKIVEKEVIKEVRVEVPVEKIVEKEVIKEVRVEVPVEKIVEKVVVDDTRVKELEGLLEEERRHSTELQNKVDETSRNAAEQTKDATERENTLKAEIAARDAAITSKEGEIARLEASLRDAADREKKFDEHVKSLEDELRRLPQAASEVADIQAAVYGIITAETSEIEREIDIEKCEFEEMKRRYEQRADRLQERRRELVRRSGANIEEMTRKALVNRPEDPRTAQLRKELEALRRTHDHAMLDKDMKIKALSDEIQLQKAEESRASESARDVAQLTLAAETLREKLQTREKELMEARQHMDELVQQYATKQQMLQARLASLEASAGRVDQTVTNQSREAHRVKLPDWMTLRR